MPAHSRTVLIRLMRQAEQVNPFIARQLPADRFGHG